MLVTDKSLIHRLNQTLVVQYAVTMVYRRLLNLNEEVKAGQTGDVLALDLLMAGVAG